MWRNAVVSSSLLMACYNIKRYLNLTFRTDVFLDAPNILDMWVLSMFPVIPFWLAETTLTVVQKI